MTFLVHDFSDLCESMTLQDVRQHGQGNGGGDMHNGCTSFTKKSENLRLHFGLTKKTHQVRC